MEEKRQHMIKRMFTLIGLGCIVTFLLVACGSTAASTTETKNAVHMSDTNFVQSSITIKKGESITLIDDTMTPHIISNGMWMNGSAKAASEPGAPDVKNKQFNGNDSGAIGPFTTAGTFQLYCTIHSGMNLTVTVQ